MWYYTTNSDTEGKNPQLLDKRGYNHSQGRHHGVWHGIVVGKSQHNSALYVWYVVGSWITGQELGNLLTASIMMFPELHFQTINSQNKLLIVKNKLLIVKTNY